MVVNVRVFGACICSAVGVLRVGCVTVVVVVVVMVVVVVAVVTVGTGVVA